jgi:tricorn protease
MTTLMMTLRARAARLAAAFLSLLVLVTNAGAAPESTRLLRFPDVHGEQLVFTYAGDLWLASTRGGTARRLTSHPGLELFARFSPDGQQLAFTGQYDGDEQVYVVSASGGVPRRLTSFPAWGPLPARWGYDNQVYGWSPDGTRVLFRSLRYASSVASGRLFTVSLAGGLPEPLPMPVAGGGALSPDGKRVIYSPLFRDFRTWKRYQGGWAQSLHIFDLDSGTSRPLTSHPRTERDPMWFDDKICYASDADGTLNLYRHDPKTSEKKQLTHSKTWDVRWPSADEDGQIVYELGGLLQLLDTQSGETRELQIVVPDDGVASRPSRVSAASRIDNVEIGSDGRRALFMARGDVFSVPVEHGPTRNLTRTPGVHEKWGSWSPDGRLVAFISDETGEEEIWIVPQDGKGEPTQLTFGSDRMLYRPIWSPDSKRIAFSDKSGRIRVLTVGNRQVAEVADNPSGRVFDYRWSPCSGHLAFSLGDANGFSSIWIWSSDDGEARRVTADTFSEFGPAWDPSGRYLYYFSDREFAPQIASFEWNYASDRETGIFAFALTKEVPHPFPLRSDEVRVEDEDEKGKEEAAQDEKKNDTTGEKKEVPAANPIDFDGLADRVVRVPVASDNYQRGSLRVLDDKLLYVRSAPFYYGRASATKPALKSFSFKDRKETTVLDGVRYYRLSADGKAVLVAQRGAHKIIDTGSLNAASAKSLSTAGLVVDRVPKQEWAQIFDEVWRRYRDFFYVANLHGYDWKALRDRYRPLLAHVAHRSDLNYVLGEMIAELNVSHAYITGGDWEQPARPKVALLGARIVLDKEHGRYRIATILRGQNEEEIYRSPLTEVGVDVEEGDYLLAIDGDDLTATDNPYALLRHKACRPITLSVNKKPTLDGAREVVVRPVGSEAKLNYLTWVLRNRELVAEATGGRVGYIHVPDMGSDGIREFIKWFYGQVRKEGLVVDVRGNGGGNVSQMLIERLRRRPLGYGFSRNSDFPSTYPGVAVHGHMACILDGNSASDGDIFPYMFRKVGLGPLIGKRSWGGVIGITNRGTLIDGGVVNVPEFGMNGLDGAWVVEGHGVDPDIVVEQDPKALIDGRDPQLERAIEEVLERMKKNPLSLPKRPADPVRTK